MSDFNCGVSFYHGSRFGALRDFIISSSVGLPIPISFDFSSILISLSVCLSLSEPKSSIDSCKL